ncbi:chemotaxis protein CheY [Candidatus Magnetomorum sp. HK-1]|nr:chemotaxis protein CheY [Candidatus Magnetomorum sp. HK-1]
MSLKHTLLIVDDVPENIDVIRDTLKDDYRMIATTRGEKAFQLACKKKPDLILLDIMMPDVDGYTVCKKLKTDERTSDIPIFFTTALNSEADETKGLSLGAADYITKPFCMPIVRERIRSQLELKEHRDRLEDLVDKRTYELSESQKQIIYRLSLASEYRDPETGSHIKRMSHYCQLLFKHIGRSDKECERILHASPMHDVGKIGIPDSILLKPGKLTNEEFETMKQHTTIGKRILSGQDPSGKEVLPSVDSPLIEMAISIAHTHHEKWDGTGYPNKLRKTDIPIEGRIAALSDVFDALTSERPYKKAWPVEEALEEILKLKEKSFDPDLVKIFEEIFSEILIVKSRFSDKQ